MKAEHGHDGGTDHAQRGVDTLRTREPGEGSVLILALWTLFFLGALVVAVGAHVSAALRVAEQLKNVTELRYLARAGVERAAMEIAADTNAWDGTGQAAWNNGADRFVIDDLGGGEVSVTYARVPMEGQAVTNTGVIGEEGKINVNEADQDILEAAFTVLGGAEESRAARICEALQAYRKQRGELLTSESSKGYPPEPRAGQGRLQSVQELLLVTGAELDTELFSRVEPYLTVFGSGRINVNAADVRVLRCCAEAYPAFRERIEEIIRAREAGQHFETREAFGAFAFMTVRSTCFGGVATARLHGGQGRFKIAFVVDREARKIFWQEQ